MPCQAVQEEDSRARECTDLSETNLSLFIEAHQFIETSVTSTDHGQYQQASKQEQEHRPTGSVEQMQLERSDSEPKQAMGCPIKEEDHDQRSDVEPVQAMNRDSNDTDSAKAFQKGDLKGMMASKDERILFIIPPQSLEFDSSGADFVAFGEIRIQIPPYAIPNGCTGRLEIGVCLCGPFKFEKNYRLISPILYICLQGENTYLNRPVKVTLPHILPDLSEDELASFGVGFAKAGHDCVTDASGKRVYQFRPSEGKSFYYADGGKGYGTLETNHFCFMCLRANSGVTKEKAKDVGYYLISVLGHRQLCVYATYFLETCITALKEQLDDNDRIWSKACFTLSEGKDHMIVDCDPREAVNMVPSNGKIREVNVDFWGSGKTPERMKLEHKEKIYPPRVKITPTDLSSVQKVRVKFTHLKEDDDLDIDVTLCQGADVIGLPSTDASFKQQGDTSDFKVIKAEANYYIPPCWDLGEAHGKGINGKGITIAVLDSAINQNHAVFANTRLSGMNFVNSKGGHFWFSNREQHGTMVTGIITKYAPKAKIHVCCVSEENKYKQDAIIKALKHIKDENDCQVIVMSFGHYKNEEYEDRKKLINDLASKGVICVAAIGNTGLYSRDLAYPARLENVIAVGGLTEDGHEAAKFNPPGKIDVYAPGEAVCVPSDTSNSKYRKCCGTSCAAPAIGGIVALLMQLAPGNVINNVKLVRTIFSHMKTKVTTTTLDGKEENIEIFDPAYFFNEYDTSQKFLQFLQGCM